VDLDVAQGNEEEIADEVRDCETSASIECDKPWPAAPMGNIDAVRSRAPVGRVRVSGRNKESVGAADESRCRFGEAMRTLERAGYDWTEIAGLSRLNVFRAVAEALLDRDGKAIGINRAYCTVDAIAPARMRLQAEDAQLRAGVQIVDNRIARHWGCPNA
jgi:hypothetical protein